MIHKFSRYLLTLVALLAMTTGAWADEGELLVTIESKAYKSFKSGSETFDDKVTVTFSNEVKNDGDKDGWYTYGESLLTVAGINGYTITSCKFYTNKGIASTGYTVEGESPSVYLNSLDVYNNVSKSEYIGYSGVTKIEVYGTKAAGPEVTISDDKTSAEFDMPSYDATLEYDIVRNLASNTTLNLFIGEEAVTADARLRIAKNAQTGAYAPVSALSFTLTDAPEGGQTTTLTAAQALAAKLNPVYELKGEVEDQWTVVAINETTHLPATLAPGQTYRVSLVAADDAPLYGGEVQAQYLVTLFEGYEVTVPAHEYVTYCSTEALTLEDENAALYTITAVSNSEATLSRALTVAPATTPLLVENTSDESRTILLIPTDKQADDVTPATEFIGVLDADRDLYKNNTFDFYAFNGLDFVLVNNLVTIPVGKCFIGIQTGNLSARSITIRRSATAIDATLVNSEEVNSEEWFDLNGRKVNKPTKKGIYIKNGQKVVIK